MIISSFSPYWRMVRMERMAAIGWGILAPLLRWPACGWPEIWNTFLGGLKYEIYIWVAWYTKYIFGWPDIWNTYLGGQIYEIHIWVASYMKYIFGRPDKWNTYLGGLMYEIHIWVAWDMKYIFGWPEKWNTYFGGLKNEIHNWVAWNTKLYHFWGGLRYKIATQFNFGPYGTCVASGLSFANVIKKKMKKGSTCSYVGNLKYLLLNRIACCLTLIFDKSSIQRNL